MNEEKSYFQDEHDLGVHDESYKPISGMAVLSFVVALFSLASIAFPFLIVLNLGAAIVAVIAILKINKLEQFGMKLAQWSLFLAVLAGVVTLGYHWGRTAYLNSFAKKHSKTLLTHVLDNRYGEAFQFGTLPTHRLPEGTDWVKYYSDTERPKGEIPPWIEVLGWKSQPPLSVVEMDRRQGKFRFMGYGESRIVDHIWEPYVCIFKYEPASSDLEDEAPTFGATMLRRTYDDGRSPTWRFFEFVHIAGPQPKQGLQTVGTAPPGADEKSEAKSETRSDEK